MSVLFNAPHGRENDEDSFRNRNYSQQFLQRRIGQKEKRKNEESLLVFGYACNTYHDDEKAMFFDEGKHLIPWMGDKSLMIDRYDGRLLLEDLTSFISKASQLPTQEQEIEQLCDQERYRALEHDRTNYSDDEEEEMKRFRAAIASEVGSYNEVGMTYGEENHFYPQYNYDATHLETTNPNALYYSNNVHQTESEPIPLLQQHYQLQQMQHEQQLAQQSIQQQQIEQPSEPLEDFVPPKELNIPKDMELPDTAKHHVIIERTAFFIKDHGAQMEIVVKAKQSGNPQFDFLQFDHRLNPYYKLILKAIRSGNYEPAKPAVSPEKEVEESDEESSDGEMELHPLLTASLRNPISSKKKTDIIAPVEPPPLPPGWTVVNPEDPGTSSFTMKADTFLATMNMMGHAGEHTSTYSDNSYVIPGTHSSVERHESPRDPSIFYQNNSQANLSNLFYHDNEAYGGHPIIPPPPDLKPICDKLAQYVARNGKQFEENIRAKNDPRFDFINETSDHYTYYRSRIRQFQNDPVVISNKSVEENVSKSGVLVPSSKPVSFQIKKKDDKRTVMEYKSSILYKTAKADENDEDGLQKDVTGIDVDSKKGGGTKTQEDIIAEERATKLKQEKEKEVERLEEEAKSTTSSLRRQVQLERRRRAQLFINMLKKANPSSSEQAAENSRTGNTNL